MANELAVIEPKELRKSTEDRIGRMIKDEGLILPDKYSYQNALASAILLLQKTEDRNHKPVLKVCSKNSIYNALLDMVITGMDPAKNQVYFIAYGTELTCQRSYFGNEALAKRVDPRIDYFEADVILKGEEISVIVTKSGKSIDKHIIDFPKRVDVGIEYENIIGAYARAFDKDGNAIRTDVMTIDEIKKSWSKSQMKPFDEKGNLKKSSTHYEFPGEMAKRTVINRLCKPIIKTSSDETLMASVNRQEMVVSESESESVIKENENMEVIDIDHEYVEERPEPEREPEPTRQEEVVKTFECPKDPDKNCTMNECKKTCNDRSKCQVYIEAVTNGGQQGLF